MSIDTRQNRPNKESEHGAETRDYSQHGGRYPGDSRFAVGSSGGYPTFSPYYEAAPEDGENLVLELEPEAPPEGPDSTILADVFPSPEAGPDGEG